MPKVIFRNLLSLLIFFAVASSAQGKTPRPEIERISAMEVDGYIGILIEVSTSRTLCQNEGLVDRNRLAKFGFESSGRFITVQHNVIYIASHLDRKTGEFLDARRVLERQIATVLKDPDLTETDRSLLIEDLTAAMQQAPAYPFPDTVPFVFARLRELQKAMEQFNACIGERAGKASVHF